jgi:flavin-dependent dehydrogenase
VTHAVRIAGGGLSGLATAVLLARRGMAVEVFDRHTGGGGRFHGGWQVLENGTREQDALDELRALGLEPGFAAVPARRATFLDGSGQRHEMESREPYAYFIRRGSGGDSLDGWLRGLARESGVCLREGVAAPGGVDVVATGPRQADGVARESVFASDLHDTVAVLFDPRVTPTGYAYLFCLSGHATFGVAQVRGTGGLAHAAKLAWARFQEAFGAFSVDCEHEGGQFMNFSLPRHLCDGTGRWHVGEAAGVQDFLFGLGNRLALRTAALAAVGVCGEWDGPRFQREVVEPMRATVALRFVYEALGRRGLTRFCRAAARRDFRTFLTRLQRPTAAKLAFARAVMAVWRERRDCRHGPLCAWCRRRER